MSDDGKVVIKVRSSMSARGESKPCSSEDEVAVRVLTSVIDVNQKDPFVCVVTNPKPAAGSYVPALPPNWVPVATDSKYSQYIVFRNESPRNKAMIWISPTTVGMVELYDTEYAWVMWISPEHGRHFAAMEDLTYAVDPVVQKQFGREKGNNKNLRVDMVRALWQKIHAVLHGTSKRDADAAAWLLHFINNANGSMEDMCGLRGRDDISHAFTFPLVNGRELSGAQMIEFKASESVSERIDRVMQFFCPFRHNIHWWYFKSRGETTCDLGVDTTRVLVDFKNPDDDKSGLFVALTEADWALVSADLEFLRIFVPKVL